MGARRSNPTTLTLFLWIEPAVDDLYVIVKYSELDSVSAAPNVAKRIFDAAEFLSEFSQMGRPGSDQRRANAIAGLHYVLVYEIR